MILYLDTSALLKRYFKEVGSTDVISRWKEASAIVTSSVTYAETLASIYRKRREVSIDDIALGRLIDSFQQDWNTFICVGVTNDLNQMIDKILSANPLRGFDAIHLASALMVRERVSEDFIFASYDRRLAKAAQMENLSTIPARIE